MHERTLDAILGHYQHTFGEGAGALGAAPAADPLMAVFGITAEDKAERPQYWARHLGACWERLVVNALLTHPLFSPPRRRGRDEPCDLLIGDLALDTKYRVGSGDAGTLKKFRSDARWLTEQGLTPVMLVLRPDSLEGALRACVRGGWRVHAGEEAFAFIENTTGVDLGAFLDSRAGRRRITPTEQRPLRLPQMPCHQPRVPARPRPPGRRPRRAPDHS